MFKFILKTLGFLPVIIIILALNVIVDPAKVSRSSNYENGIADILLDGNNVGNVLNYNERLVIKHYIENVRNGLEVIVLGSSRSMGIGSGCFTPKSFFNCCVSGATLEDYMAIYSLVDENRRNPKIVVFGLDPWILNNNNGQTRWRSIGSAYKNIYVKIKNNFPGSNLIEKSAFIEPEISFKISQLRELVNISYFQASLGYVFKNPFNLDFFSDKFDYYSTKDLASDVDIKLYDGTLNYNNKFILKNNNETLRFAQEYINEKPIYCLKDFNRLDASYSVLFKYFIKYLDKNDVKVVFFLPSYHPYVYNYLNNSPEYKIINEAERFFKEVASESGITVIGSYNPDKCGLADSDFLDGMHLKNSSVERMFKNVIDSSFLNKKNNTVK